jgi:hypothetical protein
MKKVVHSTEKEINQGIADYYKKQIEKIKKKNLNKN